MTKEELDTLERFYTEQIEKHEQLLESFRYLRADIRKQQDKDDIFGIPYEVLAQRYWKNRSRS